MKLLVLGGTLFLGRHVVTTALQRGFEVTTFTRGRTNPGLFPEAEALRGDRDGNLAALRGRAWDAVIDTSAYVPRQAAAAARVLRDAVERYAFVSTASVYAVFPPGGAPEGAATHTPPDTPEVIVRPDTYGLLKVGCERAIVDAFGERALIVRPGVLAGPFDPTNRVAYWVHRVADGGEVLAPGNPARPIQLLDARDLADWLISMVTSGGTGVFNASGPELPLTMEGFLEASRSAAGSDARFTWVADEFLLAHAVAPWSELPLWLPAELSAALLLDSRKAYAAGLHCRPLVNTLADVLTSSSMEPESAAVAWPRASGIARERERELVRAWLAAGGGEANSGAAPLGVTTS